MTHLTRAPIAIDQLVAEVSAPECGGTCLFLGTVRNGPEESGVAAIEYTAYDDMADAELQRIVADALQRWPSARIALRHRLGHVAVGEPGIAIVTAAPHRAQAVGACRHASGEGKRRLPVWKKELRADGTELGRKSVV